MSGPVLGSEDSMKRKLDNAPTLQELQFYNKKRQKTNEQKNKVVELEIKTKKTVQHWVMSYSN